MITIKNLSKSFGRGTRALDSVSLSLDTGEMVALIGASGSGKSTLIRNVAGLTAGDPGSGAVSVLGHEVQSGGRLSRKLSRMRVETGVIFQQFNLVGRLSVLTNVLMGLLGRVPSWRGTLSFFTQAERERGMAALARVGIAQQAGQRASTLSGGQQQRAAIARAMVQGAKVLLADEPIASLDPAAASRVMDLLSEINREDGITILVSLHQVDYAIRYCPRTIAMRDGRIVFDGPSTVLTPEFLRELYGAESEDLFMPTSPVSDMGEGEADAETPEVPVRLSLAREG